MTSAHSTSSSKNSTKITDKDAAAKWAWESDNAFVAEYDPIGNIDRWRVELAAVGLRSEFALAPVNTHLDLADDPQVLANGYIVDYEHPAFGSTKTLGLPITLGETPGGIKLPAPEWGQHTEEVLMEVGGLSWEEIALLREEEVI